MCECYGGISLSNRYRNQMINFSFRESVRIIIFVEIIDQPALINTQVKTLE